MVQLRRMGRQRDAAVAGILFVLLAGLPARAHDEPPKTATELADTHEQWHRLAAAGIAERRLYETVAGAPETWLLSDTFDVQGRQVGQVVGRGEDRQRSRSSYDAAGDWVLEETWQGDQPVDRTTFSYDAQHLMTGAVSEDLATGASERLAYDRDRVADTIVATKTRADSLVYVIRFRYEPGGGLACLAEATRTGPRGEPVLRTSQAWRDGQRQSKAVYGSDGNLAYEFRYDYDHNGDLAVVTKRDAAGRLLLRQVYARGADRLPTSVTDHDADGRVTRTLRYEYVRR